MDGAKVRVESEILIVQGVIEDRSYVIKRFTNPWRGEETAYNDIVLSARGSNYSGFLRVIGCCLQFPLPVAVFDDLGYRPAFLVESVGRWDLGNILDSVKDMQERREPVEFGGDLNEMRAGQMKMFLDLALRCCEKRNEDRPTMISVAKEIKLIEKYIT
ncbi:hypothetical protein YC2023_091197 [Brassica napus]